MEIGFFCDWCITPHWVRGEDLKRTEDLCCQLHSSAVSSPWSLPPPFVVCVTFGHYWLGGYVKWLSGRVRSQSLFQITVKRWRWPNRIVGNKMAGGKLVGAFAQPWPSIAQAIAQPRPNLGAVRLEAFPLISNWTSMATVITATATKSRTHRMFRLVVWHITFGIFGTRTCWYHMLLDLKPTNLSN